MQEIAMCHVQLDNVESDAHGAPGRLGELGLDAGQPIGVELIRRWPAVVERHRGGSHGPPRILVWTERLSTFPGPLCRTPAASMRDLNAEARARQSRGPGGGKCAGERPLVILRVETKAAVGDAAMTLDIRHLDHHQTSSGHG